jgi:uncharacterized protein YjdB
MQTNGWVSRALRAIRRLASRLTLTALAVAGVTLWAVACSDGPSEPAHQHTVATISLSQAALSMHAGDQATLTATTKCTCGATFAASLTWTSSDPSVATVSQTGVVTGVKFGSAVVTATAQGQSASATVQVAAVGTVVGPAGGTVVSSDGNATLVIPAGALAANEDIVLAKLDEAGLVGDPLFIAGTAYGIEPVAAQLQIRAQLRIRFDPAQVPAGVYQEQLRIRERSQNQWRDQEHVGLQNQEVVGAIDRFGAFGIVAQPPVGTLIGPLGGTAVSADGNLEVVIPAGALTALTDLVITKADDAVFGGDPQYVAGTGYQIDGALLAAAPAELLTGVFARPASPAPVELQVQARIRLRYDPAHLPTGVYPEQLRIRLREQTQLRDCDHDGLQQGQMVQARTDRLGLFGLFIRPPTGTLIGPLGGTAVSADGLAELVVPAGALDAVTDVVITPGDPTAFASDPLYVTGTAYTVEPDLLALDAAGLLRIHYDPANLPAGVTSDRLRIRERDRQQNRWRDCTHVGLQGNVVVGSIEQLGLFAVVATPAPQPKVAMVSVSPSTIAVEEGDLIQLTAIATDATGTVVNVAITWSTDDEAIAVVSSTGVLTAVAEGTTSVSATADGVSGKASVNVRKKVQPASIAVTPTSGSLAVGTTLQLTADIRDAAGNPLSLTATWSSSAPGVATVSSTGLVTGVALGTATITAKVQALSATASITVVPPVSAITVDLGGNEPLEVGLTRQALATAIDGAGQPIQVTFTWSSSDAGIASVDQTGLVTGVGKGTATITAAVGTESGSASIKVVGGETTIFGNNMSWPTVFADGIGMLGTPVATDPGVRPLVAEAVTVDASPFFWSGNLPDYGIYHEQQGENTWRAMWLDGTGQAAYDGEAYWGDNLTVKEWSASRPIRVEIALSATGVGTLTGYNMFLLYGSGIDEMQGTDGTTAEFVPLIYTVGPTITVEKLAAQGGGVTATVADEPIGAEVNVGGRIVYGYQLKLDATGEGWYRLRFRLATGANVMLQTVGNTEGMFLPVIVSPKETAMEIHVTP